MKTIAILAAALAAVLPALAACSDSPKTDAEYKADVVASMHGSIGADLADLVQAALDLQAAAPTHAWDPIADSAAITAMRVAWMRSRIAYEHVEGATAPIFGSLDVSMDARYDDFLAKLVPDGDPDLFDASGATGMHAIERILYAHDIRSEVIVFESPLPGYVPAAYPATNEEAVAFKTQLARKLVDDAISLRDQWKPAAIDIGAAFQGLVGLMNEQKEKVNLAATGEEESRYANLTLFDLRNNLDGTDKAYALFRAWIQARAGGGEIDAKIQAGFTELAQLYAALPGDALPAVPDDWSADAPTPANLATGFGMLWQTVHQDVDPTRSGSVVFEMNQVATMLGFPEFIEE
jgi:iron uptake system component EfeO